MMVPKKPEKIVIFHIGSIDDIESEEFESNILQERQLEKNENVEIVRYKLDDELAFITEKNPRNLEDKEIKKELSKLNGGDKIYILSHGQPNAVKIGMSTHFSVLGNYLSKGLKRENFIKEPLNISIHACRAGKGSNKKQNSFAGLLHHYLGKLNINTEVTARTELVHIDSKKYKEPGSGILTITPTKHAFSYILSKLNLKTPDSWYKYKKPGTKVKFIWDENGRQVKLDHYVSKYNNNIFQQLNLLLEFYKENADIKSIIEVITNDIQKNINQDNYSNVAKKLTRLLNIINKDKKLLEQGKNNKNNLEELNNIYEKLVKYKKNILQKNPNSFKKVIFKHNKFSDRLSKGYTTIESKIRLSMLPLDNAINNINQQLFPNEQKYNEACNLFKEMRQDLYQHLRHKYTLSKMPTFSIKQAKKIITEVANVTNVVLNKNENNTTEDLELKKDAVDKFLKNNSKYLKSSKLLRIKYIFAGIKEGIKTAIRQGGKEMIVNIFAFAKDTGQFRYTYFNSYKDQLKKVGAITKEVVNHQKEQRSRSL